MSSEPSSQFIQISGGQLSNVQLGQAGRDLTQIQDQNQNQDKMPTSDEVKILLTQLKDLISKANLSADKQTKALSYLNTVEEEVKTAEPDKEFALKGFQRVTKALKQADEVAEAGQGLWQKLEPIATKLAPWFGVTAKTLLLL